MERHLGVGTSARMGKVFHTELRNVEIRCQRQENEIVTDYLTAVGKVSSLHRSYEQLNRIGIMGIEVEHLIKGPDGSPMVEYILQQTDTIQSNGDLRRIYTALLCEHRNKILPLTRAERIVEKGN